MEIKISGRKYACLFEIHFHFSLLHTVQDNCSKYWVDQKVRLGFSINLTEKPEQTFWPTQYLQSILSFLVLSFLSQNVMCIYALILLLSVDW